MSSSTSHDAIDLDATLAAAQLPALPQSAIALLELAKDTDNGPAEFAVPIEIDPGLASQVLRFVNSSYFGFSREIDSVKLAITLVGIRTIKNFALWSAVFSLMPNPKCGPFDLKKLWQDSLRRGLFAREVAKQLKAKDTEAPFAAALLQDLAVPMLSKELGESYEKLIEERTLTQARLSHLEQERFGWNHAEAGGRIARKWNLPEEFATLIERHADIDALLADPSADAGQYAVALSAMLPAASTETWTERDAFVAAYTRILPAGQDLSELLANVDKQFEDFAPVLKITTPARSLSDFYASDAAVAG